MFPHFRFKMADDFQNGCPFFNINGNNDMKKSCNAGRKHQLLHSCSLGHTKTYQTGVPPFLTPGLKWRTIFKMAAYSLIQMEIMICKNRELLGESTKFCTVVVQVILKHIRGGCHVFSLPVQNGGRFSKWPPILQYKWKYFHLY